MGKLSLRARLERDERVAAGLPPYEVRKGSGSRLGVPGPATAHPGSKRRFPRLEVVTDTQGRRHVVWPERKRKGGQAAPLPAVLREASYRAQNGTRTALTPAQQRRLDGKRRTAAARAGGSDA